MRGFIATAEAGSLSAAARRLGLTQPTLSRQVSALEERLRLTLFERIGKKLVLTETGLDLLHHGKRMAEAADALSLAATGRSETIGGLVSISASDGAAVHLLPPIVKRLRSIAPQVSIEIVASNALSDLRRREADIAVRHVRPQEPDLIGKHIRDASAHFYASKSWVAKNGLPTHPDDVKGAPFISFDRSGRFADYLQGLGVEVTADSFPALSENSLAAWELVKQGLGIGVMMDDIAVRSEGLVQVLTNIPALSFPIWLVTHRELRTSRRIRLVFDVLAEDLAKPTARPTRNTSHA